jgi:reverse gyrase
MALYNWQEVIVSWIIDVGLHMEEFVISCIILPGYGKSLLIIITALELAAAEENVLIVVPNDFLVQ